MDLNSESDNVAIPTVVPSNATTSTENKKNESVQETIMAALKGGTAKNLLKNKKIVAVGVAAILLIAILSFVSYTSPRTLDINSGEDIEAYVGDTTLVFTIAEGLGGFYDDVIVWTCDDPNLVKIENGILEASYDKNAFNASEYSLGRDDNSSYTTYIHGTLKKGLRTWEGDAKVIVSLKEELHFNGQVYVEPSASTDSYIEVKAADDYSTYFYLKSQTDTKNDISFIVDEGSETRVYVPCDTYEIYEAHGKTWYGPDIIFGPDTVYMKSESTAKFTPESYWTLTLDTLLGNSKSENINSNEFPDSSEENSSGQV